jgi:hypothetical protein
MAAPFASFKQAISDKLLFKGWYDQLTFMQQTVLLAFYGVPLRSQEHRQCWAILNGAYTADPLGYPTEIGEFPYTPRSSPTRPCWAGTSTTSSRARNRAWSSSRR